MFFNTPAAALVPASLPGTAPALANKATLATPAGAAAFATAVSGGVVAADLTALNAARVGGAAIVLPQFTVQGFSIAAESLSVGSGSGTTAASPISSFNLAAASVLTNSAAATGGGQGNQLTNSGGTVASAALTLANEGRAVPNTY